ncbi:MAG: gliding motility-associated C-terminal domain-containing protein [Chitinophagaceae bacterium]|nr:gliding motility-associated C-terminal domain-containing protein [Chitinophagaceae bacterium]
MSPISPRPLLLTLMGCLSAFILLGQSPGFTLPVAVCPNTPVTIKNTSTGGTSFYWSFCDADPNTIPEAANMGNISNVLSQPVFLDVVSEGGNYYGFLVNHYPGALIRLDFGNNLLNTPTAVSLGNLGALNPGYGSEGIQMVKDNGHWYALIVGGSPSGGGVPKIVQVDFGASVTNPAPVATDWGNLGTLLMPIDLYVFRDNGVLHAFTVNAESNTLTRFDFSTAGPAAPPAATNMGNPGGLLNYPTGIFALNTAGNWHVFITNGAGGNIVRLDFGNSLLNTPVPINLGNPGGVIQSGRDITILQSCDQIIGLVADGTAQTVVKLDFHNDVLSVPTAVNLGNIGNFNFPHSLSTPFRVGGDLYSFLPNAYNNTLSRIRFPGCNSSSIPGSNLADPPVISYSQPGTYRVSLIMDDGLPTQTSLCQTITVLDTPKIVLPHEHSFCSGDSLVLRYNGPVMPLQWQDGSSLDTFTVRTTGTYKLTATNMAGCAGHDTSHVEVVSLPMVAAHGDTSICKGTSLLLSSIVQNIDSVRWTPSIWLSDTTVTSPLAVPKKDTTYVLTAWHKFCPVRDTVRVNIDTLTITVSNDTLVCHGQTAYLQVKGAQPYQYNWSPGPFTTDHIAIAADSSMYFHVRATDANTCTTEDSIFVQIKYPDIFRIKGAPLRICAGDSTRLIVTGADPSMGDYYTWMSDIGTQDPSSGEIVVAPSTTTIYRVLARDSICGLRIPLSIRVNVDQRPEVTISKSNDIDCIYGEARLTATGGVSYTWYPATTLDNPYKSDPVARTDTSTWYYVLVAGMNGCSILDSIPLYATKGGGNIGFPVANAFTPNGDGHNDCFGIKYWGYVGDFEMTIFNRWGQKVYGSKNPSGCWDGTFNGQPQPAGVYVYYIRAHALCGDAARKGTVTLIR